MTQFTIHDEHSAPEASQPILAGVRKSLGFIPNLYGVLAEAPVAAEAYSALTDLVTRSSFTPVERHVVWFANIVENDCRYCMAAHTGLAKLEGVPDDVIEATRRGVPYADTGLEALREFTRSLVVNRGWVAEGELDAFFAAGYTQAQVLEIVVAVAHKVVSTYTNHIAHTPLDKAFQAHAWQKSEPVAKAG